ncbi:glycoside hydrolase family 16 protein [Microbacterium sp. LWH3-1.2]|uniref:glycoside hydrolase family 16 protein n=1 Tax=Microbacterium sp. LWH3-1.2 TaxID=3135256 RepID=UPI0034210841
MTATAPFTDPGSASSEQTRRRRRRRRLTLGICSGILAIVLVLGGVWWFTGFSFLGARYGDDSVLFEDFDGAAGEKPNPDVWRIQTGGGGWGNNELQEYTEDAVALDGDGNLVITATVPEDGSQPTSGRITSHGMWSFTYGRLSARIKLPEGQGLLPAFWLLGDNVDRVGWPAAGEVDIIETPNTTSRSAHHLHGPTGITDRWSLDEGYNVPVPLADDFHVYTVEKHEGRIIMAIDDQIVMDVEEWDVPIPGRWVFDAPTHALFSLAVGGNWPGDPDASTPVVNEMVIDWMSFTPEDQLGDTPIGSAGEVTP